MSSLGRLAEYKPTGTEAKQAEHIEMGAVSTAAGFSEEDQAKMKEFFRQVQEIRQGMEQINKKTNEIEKCHQHALNSVRTDEQYQYSKQIENLMDQTTATSNVIRKSLKDINKTNKSLKLSIGASHPNLRIRMAQHAQLTHLFITTMDHYSNVQHTYQNKYRQNLQRQYLLVNPSATREELDRVVENEGGSMMSQQIFSIGEKKVEARRALEEMQERHQDIMMIERGIMELNQLFIELQALVEQQGDLVDQIEHHVEHAQAYTEQAAVEMKTAVRHQKARLKKKWILVGLMLVLVVGGALVIVFTILPSSSD